MNTERISLPQVTMLLVVSRLSLTLVYFGAPPGVGHDVWWESFFAALAGVAILWLVQRICRRFPRQTLYQAAELALSRPLGKLVTLLYVLFFLLLLSLNLRLVGEFFLFAFLTRTPISVVIGVVAMLAIWVTREGMEVIGRVGQVVFPLLIGSILLIIGLLAKDMDLKLLAPPVILTKGPIAHLQDLVNVTARTAEFAWLALLVPYVNRPFGLFRAAVRAQLWLGAIWVVMSVTIIGVLGRDFETHFFPFYVAAREVHIADFLERIDAIFLSMWLFGMFLRVSMLLWSTAVGTAQLLGFENYRAFVVPLAGIAGTYAIMMAGTFAEVRSYFAAELFTPFGLFFLLVLPALVLGIAAVRRIRRPPPWQPPL